MKSTQELWVTLGAILLCAAPILVLPTPPMEDLSEHVLVARVLVDYHNAAFAFDKYFDVHWELHPGVAFYALLSGLQLIAAPFTAAKIYLLAWITALWASVYFLARSNGSRKPWIAALAVMPLTFSWYLYSGFLPFVTTIPLFALIVGLWRTNLRASYKVPLVALVLCVSFLFHVVGAGAAALALCVSWVFSRVRSDPPVPLWQLALTVLPVGALTLVYLFGTHHPQALIHWTSPLSNLAPVIRYTVGTLSGTAVVLLLAWLGGLALAALMRREIWSKESLVLTGPAVVLAAIACVLPVTFGSLWPAGPRLFPFALVLLVVSVPWEEFSSRLLTVSLLALLGGLSASTSLKAASLASEYQDFLSGIPLISPGARILPILVDQHEVSHWVDPFGSLASYYTIARGGENPYVFADPYVKTAASPIRYRWRETRYAFPSHVTVQPSAYRGVSDVYDYVLLWGTSPELEAVLAEEMSLLQRKGRLSVYGSRHVNAGTDRP